MAESNAIRLKNFDRDDPEELGPGIVIDITGFGQVSFPLGLTIPGNTDSGPFVEISCFKYERGFRQNTVEDRLYKIQLPFPFTGINYSATAVYDPFNAIVGRGVAGGEDLGAVAGGLAEGAVSELGRTMAGGAAQLTADVAGKLGSSTIDADRIKNQASTVAGVLFNPRLELLYNGHQLRQFGFSWILLPRNANESSAIRDILEKLELSYYPSYKDDLKVFLDYPDEFVIGFYNPDGTNIKGAPMISDCFMTDFSYSVNQSSAGRVFTDGSPTSYTISATFGEANYLTREDIALLRRNQLPTNE